MQEEERGKDTYLDAVINNFSSNGLQYTENMIQHHDASAPANKSSFSNVNRIFI